MYMIMDMGTSNTRLWLCTQSGNTCVNGSFGAGITRQKGKAFLYGAVKALIEELLLQTGVDAAAVEHILVSGMATSELGLWEVPHIAIPADIYTLADKVQIQVIPEITRIPFVLVPGLKKETGGTIADIMRGEEVETAGVLALNGICEDALLILPGTHNKMILVDKDGVITDFYTTMSGEILNCSICNTILAGQVSHEFTLQEAELLRGAAYGAQNGLNAALFHIRILAKNGMDPNGLSSFLYGCVLGQDVSLIRKLSAGRKVYIGGRANLQQAYGLLLGREAAVCLDEKLAAGAVFAGLEKLRDLCAARARYQTVLDAIAREKLIAIVRDPGKDTFMTAIAALYRGGVRLAEVTFDRSGKIPAEETAELIRQLVTDGRMLVGAGTVTTAEEVHLAAQAGAAYIISPNCDPQIIDLTKKLGLVSIPAAFTPTEIAQAARLGADYIKLFPADQLTAGYVKAVKAPLSDVKLLAVGGVDAQNAGQFIKNGFYGVGVGAGLYNKKLIQAGDWERLEALAREFVEAVK